MKSMSSAYSTFSGNLASAGGLGGSVSKVAEGCFQVDCKQHRSAQAVSLWSFNRLGEGVPVSCE